MNTWSLILFIGFGFQNEWKKITIPELGVSLMSPGYMIRVIDEFSTDAGEVTVYSYKYEPKENDPNMLYLVQAYIMTEPPDCKDDPSLCRDLLHVALENSVEKLNAQVDYSEYSRIIGGEALMYRIRYANGQRMMKSKAMIAGNLFISMQVYCDFSQSLNTSMDYFLNSFSQKN